MHGFSISISLRQLRHGREFFLFLFVDRPVRGPVKTPLNFRDDMPVKKTALPRSAMVERLGEFSNVYSKGIAPPYVISIHRLGGRNINTPPNFADIV